MQNNNNFNNTNQSGNYPMNQAMYPPWPYVTVLNASNSSFTYTPNNQGHYPGFTPSYQTATPQQPFQNQPQVQTTTATQQPPQTKSLGKTSLNPSAVSFQPKSTVGNRNNKNTSNLNPSAISFTGPVNMQNYQTGMYPTMNGFVQIQPGKPLPATPVQINPMVPMVSYQVQAVSTVPTVQAVPAVSTVPTVQAVPAVSTVPTVQPVPTVPAVPAVHLQHVQHQPVQPVQPVQHQTVQPVQHQPAQPQPAQPQPAQPQPGLNLVPRSRRNSIVDRPRDVITEEKMKEMNGIYANPNKHVYVPELLNAIWEHTDRKTLVLPADEHVNPYKWNISIRSKITAQGILGDIQSLLNKLTLENFDSIYKTFVSRKPTRIEEYKGIINLVYDKAVMEPHFATMYAKLCRMMNRDYPAIIRTLIYAKNVEGGFTCFENGDNKKALCDPAATEEEAFEKTLKSITVRRLVANKCQDELETEGKTLELEERRNELKEILKQNEDSLKHAQELMDVEFKINTIRRRTFGNVQFIGELFNCGLLRVEAVIKASFDHLITPAETADDEKTEALCKLLTTVGKTMYDNPKFSDLLETTVSRIAVLEKSPSLTSRVRFAVSDLIDLAENMWQSDQKEKLEKLSDLRMKKTIQRLEGIIEMLEKRSLSHHKSSRSPPPPPAAEIPSKSLASEVVPAETTITQTKQATYDLFSGSVRNGLQEAKSSRDSEDFWYNLETKVKDSKNPMSAALSASILYACENIKLESPELTLLCKVMDYGFENNKLNGTDFVDAYASSLQLLDYMDSPSRFKVCKALTAHFVEKEEVNAKDLETMFAKMEENPNFAFVIKSLK